jgi:hypothetical protein
MKKKGLTYKKSKDGGYRFCWNGYDITDFWINFFSGLPLKQEKNSEWIFARRYSKILNKIFPLKK